MSLFGKLFNKIDERKVEKQTRRLTEVYAEQQRQVELRRMEEKLLRKAEGERKEIKRREEEIKEIERLEDKKKLEEQIKKMVNEAKKHFNKNKKSLYHFSYLGAVDEIRTRRWHYNQTCNVLLLDYTILIEHPNLGYIFEDISICKEYYIHVWGIKNEVIQVNNEEGNVEFTLKHQSVDTDTTIELINSHFNNIKVKMDAQQQDFSENIKTKCNQLVDNEALQIMNNFISNINSQVSTKVSYIVSFEKKLYNNYDKGKKCLLTNSIKGKDMHYDSYWDFVNELDEWKYDCDSDFDVDDHTPEEVEEFHQNFIKLSKFIGKKYGIESVEEQQYVVWCILINLFIKYFHDLFKENYGHYFNEIINVATLEELVSSYCQIDLFDYREKVDLGAFTYYLMYLNKFNENVPNFINCYQIVNKLIDNIAQNKEDMNFEKVVFKNKVILKEDQDNIKIISITDIDLMTGLEFEKFVSELFRNLNYMTTVTKSTGDQGIDIIVEKNGVKYGIQAKCYSSTVSNKAVQEVVAGLKHYKLDKGIVVTNNYFTKSATELAVSNNIVLWDRIMLKQKIEEMNE